MERRGAEGLAIHMTLPPQPTRATLYYRDEAELREMCAAALRKARQRHPDFRGTDEPPGVESLVDECRRWKMLGGMRLERMPNG